MLTFSARASLPNVSDVPEVLVVFLEAICRKCP